MVGVLGKRGPTRKALALSKKISLNFMSGTLDSRINFVRSTNATIYDALEILTL
jgi:hypothetical protein